MASSAWGALRSPILAPVVFPIVGERRSRPGMQLAEYITKKLGGKPAEHAGDPAMQTTTRVFGQIFINTPGSPAEQDAADFKKPLADGGVDLAQQIPYVLDPATLQEQAAGVIQKLKAAGVTTVILSADPIAPKIFTEEATKQNYSPEWIYGGAALVDTNAFGRTYDQKQWAHAFGISSLAARVSPDLVKQYDLHTWYFGDLAPANDTYGVLYPQPALFFAGAAGCRTEADRGDVPRRSLRLAHRRDREPAADGAADHLRRSRPVARQARLLRHRRLHRDLVGSDRDR